LGTSSLVTLPNFTAPFRLLPNTVRNLVNNTLIYAITSPIKTSLGFVGMIGLVLIAMNFNTIFKNTNPASLNVKSSEERIDIFTKNGKLLFSLNYDSPDGMDIQNLENAFNVKRAVIADLNNDGKNEVAAILHNMAPGYEGIDKLNVFDYKGEFLFAVKNGRSIKFENTAFDDQFETTALIVHDFDGDGLKEIYMLSTHRNSPAVVTKLSNEGRWIGEYWHYGWFWGFNKIKLGGKEGILLCGINDMDSTNRFPVISFIDPKQIKGFMQSSQTKGFDNFVPLKEINYKYFPIITPGKEGNYKPRINNLLNTDNNSFIKVSYFLNHSEALGDIYIDKNFNSYDIKVIDQYKAKFGALQQKELELFLKK
ncbi:MAG: VCBS repeat-containing protein, partial [Bacteroidota bacterium]